MKRIKARMEKSEMYRGINTKEINMLIIFSKMKVKNQEDRKTVNESRYAFPFSFHSSFFMFFFSTLLGHGFFHTLKRTMT